MFLLTSCLFTVRDMSGYRHDLIYDNPNHQKIRTDEFYYYSIEKTIDIKNLSL